MTNPISYLIIELEFCSVTTISHCLGALRVSITVKVVRFYTTIETERLKEPTRVVFLQWKDN